MAAPTQENENEAPPASAASGGGFKAWLPLVLTIVLMPALAYVTTAFVLLPKLQKGLGQGAGHSEHESGGHGTKVQARETGKPKVKVQLSKIVVNVSGSLGTRLLLASMTLAGSAADFKDKVDEHQDQLKDIAATILGSKTIAELEKPEARNLIRSEMLTQFNTALGNGYVQEIFITEFAIQ